MLNPYISCIHRVAPGSHRSVRLSEQSPGRQPGSSQGGSDDRAAGRPEMLRVLVVEDNVDAAETLRELMELLGYSAKVARTGPEGVEAASAWRPHVVLCDIGLPGFDGYTVARLLRMEPATADVRLVAVTGYGSPADQQQARDAGFELHLTKPVDLGRLEEYLNGLKPGS